MERTDPLCAKNLDRMIDLFCGNFDRFKIGSCRFWTNTGWHNSPFRRNDFEILYFISGRVDLRIGSEKVTAQEGDLLFIDNHTGSSCAGGDFKMYYIQFVFVGSSSGLQQRQQMAGLLDAFPRPLYSGKSMALEKICENIAFELSVRKGHYITRTKSLLLDFLVQLHRLCAQEGPRTSIKSMEKHRHEIFKVIHRLSENPERSYSLAELAKMSGLSVRYFNFLFKQSTGYPVMQYLHRIRIDKAKRLLESSRLSITEIAFELNYDSSQYFCKMFKKVTGTTPSGYRRADTKAIPSGGFLI